MALNVDDLRGQLRIVRKAKDNLLELLQGNFPYTQACFLDQSLENQILLNSFLGDDIHTASNFDGIACSLALAENSKPGQPSHILFDQEHGPGCWQRYSIQKKTSPREDPRLLCLALEHLRLFPTQGKESLNAAPFASKIFFQRSTYSIHLVSRAGRAFFWAYFLALAHGLLLADRQVRQQALCRYSEQRPEALYLAQLLVYALPFPGQVRNSFFPDLPLKAEFYKEAWGRCKGKELQEVLRRTNRLALIAYKAICEELDRQKKTPLGLAISQDKK